MRVKDQTINLDGCSWQILVAMGFAEMIYLNYLSELKINPVRWPFVITSAHDGKHMNTSRHYSGNAFDMRVWAFGKNQDQVRELRDRIHAHLNEKVHIGYDVVVEVDHIHVEWDPK